MKICGLQKMTLLDFPGKVACTVFLGGCNFRCPWCHNAQLLGGDADPIMDEEALLSFLEKRRGLLDGVCITGGEPTLQPELPRLLAQIRSLGFQVKLDTNGYRPQVLAQVLPLTDYVAMDLKNGPEDYAATVGLEHFHREAIEESIRLLLESGVSFELRTTLVTPLHTARSLQEMARWLFSVTGGLRIPRLFLQPFVDRDSVIFSGFSTPSGEDLELFKEILSPCADSVEIRGLP